MAGWRSPGPVRIPAAAFGPRPGPNVGGKRRLRAGSFADHYSQARQFYLSQTDIERRHIIDAFVFELSKCDRSDIRTRMVAGLVNVHEDLARAVVDGLGLDRIPDPLPPARPPLTDLAASPPLSILRNGPDRFAGRKLGVLVTDGFDASVLDDLRAAAEARGAQLAIVAPKVSGITAGDGTLLVADQQLDGAPCALYDAVAILTTEQGADGLAWTPAARDFVTDAYAHHKFIGHGPEADRLFAAVGLYDLKDDGFVSLDDGRGAVDLITRCRKLRYWRDR